MEKRPVPTGGESVAVASWKTSMVNNRKRENECR